MPSEKTPMVEYLFDQHWDPASKSLRRSLMTQDDVQKVLRHFSGLGVTLSDRNPANFMKDIVRSSRASANWPAKLTALRITAIQRTGKNKEVFEFVPFAPGQIEPFPDSYKHRKGVKIYGVQSLSMLDESKMLGRTDESWLTQTAVNLRVVESHFAMKSPLRRSVTDVIHLQMNVKLRNTEVDAIYMARYKKGGAVKTAAITCEAKQAGERILENQIVEQAKAAFVQARFDMVIPIGIRAVTGRGIYLVEFKPVPRANALTYVKPVFASEALYELRPAVPGI
jgi:hypothetical protein